MRHEDLRKDSPFDWIKPMRTIAIGVMALFLSLCLHAEGLRLSIFAQHVEEIARQEKLTLAEAADKVKALGYDGVDITTEMSDETVMVFRQAGFEIPCVIGWPKFEQSCNATYCAETLAKAKFAGAKLVMLVPGFYTNEVDRAAQFDTIVSRTRAFAEDAAKLGFSTAIEDFDDRKSPTCGRDQVAKFLTGAPMVGLVFDTGNFPFVGEDSREAEKQFADRIVGFHLKDRPSAGSRASVSVGSGCVPMTEIIAAARAKGFDGWYTVEHFGATNMLEQATASAKYLKGLDVKSVLGLH